MPDTLPHQPDLIDDDRSAAVDAVADSVGKSATETRISPVLGPERRHVAGGAVPPPIARRLAILVIVAILPVLAFSAFMIANYSRAQHTAYMQQLQATTRATSLAIDAEVGRHQVLLETLRASPELRHHDWRAFHDFAQAAVANEPDSRVNLYEPSGQMVLTTIVPFGTDLPTTGSPDAVRTVVNTKQPFVSDLFIGAVSKSWVLPIYTPVIENGVVAYVMSVGVTPAHISRILHSAILPEGWIASLLDRNWRIVGRTTGEAESVGRRATLDFIAAINGAVDGVFESHSLEGPIIRGAFVTSALTGFTYALGAKKTMMDAPLRHSLWLLSGGGAVLLVCTLSFALFYARAIARPLVALSRIAAALGRGEHIPVQHLNLREAQATADQMRSAAEALEQRTREVGLLNANLSQHASALEVANKELEIRNQELKVANRELEGLSYSTSHVLRAPLRAIDGYSHILLQEHSLQLDNAGKRLVGVLRSSAHELNEQIDGILEFLRLGRDKLSRSEIDMAATVQMVLKDLEPITRGRIKIEVSPLPSAFGDPKMIQRVWSCLLDNAVKFTAYKSHGKIEVGAKPDGGETAYYVRDNGVGFDTKYAGKLFGVFNRLHGADFPGNGTGLAIVQRIASRHGGRVWAEGKVGEGATFYFTLPASETVHD